MTPKVEFHTGIDDAADFACRLLRKAYQRGARVLVRAAPPDLQRLDRDLWVRFEREFIPHLRLPAAPAQADWAQVQAQRTPIWLCSGEVPPQHPPVLVNLDAELPPRPQDFERIVEIVGALPEPAARARARWRAYEAAGLSPVHHAPPGRVAPAAGPSGG